MALEGTLRDFSLADIFQLIGIQRKTGVLTLKSAEDVVTVSFLDGNVVSADSQRKTIEDLLGSLLVRSGRITDEQLQDSLRAQKRTLQRLGHILIQRKLINHQDLSDALRLQVTQVIYRLFRWQDGDYSFKQEETIEYDREHFQPMSAESILMEGIRMIDEWPIIEKKICSVDMIFSRVRPRAKVEVRGEEEEEGEEDEIGQVLTGSVPAAKVPKPSPPDAVVMSAAEAQVYRHIDGERSVQELIDLAGMGDFETCRILYDLLARGIIEEARAEAARRAEPSAPRAIVSPAFWSILTGILIAGALVSGALMSRNPLNRLPPAYSDPVLDDLLVSITRSRVERLDEAIHVYYLQKGFYPDALGELTQGNLIRPTALRDGWGRPLGYFPSLHGYRIVVYGPSGEERPDLSVERRSPRPSGRRPG